MQPTIYAYQHVAERPIPQL